jgi:putative colanic acid biosysnthesis UDP-glucose lipid carrier transferase
VLRRAIDIVVSATALAFASPILLVAALAIRLESPGPIVYRQRRSGLHGREFDVLKLRTMVDGAEHKGAGLAINENDSRITRVGAFLRRTSLDELPQIFNVLEGKMSFVGPRPHAVAHNEAYRKLISGYMIRHKVRPGITGWAQVNGLRGETSTVEMMQRRIQYDLDYLKNWSLWLDLKIIVLTALTVIYDRNAY